MKKYLIILIPLLIGMSCLLAYRLIGSTLDENGIVQEPFGLLPIGFFMILLSIIFGIIIAVKNLLKK